MSQINNVLSQQINTAFDYRGNVTIRFKKGDTIEGFLFNRDLAPYQQKEAPYIEVMIGKTADKKKFPIAQIASIELTGEDTAAGKSYQDWLEKQEQDEAAHNS